MADLPSGQKDLMYDVIDIPALTGHIVSPSDVILKHEHKQSSIFDLRNAQKSKLPWDALHGHGILGRLLDVMSLNTYDLLGKEPCL
jgi:hypothetical protein